MPGLPSAKPAAPKTSRADVQILRRTPLWASITLTRPAARNALRRETIDALIEACLTLRNEAELNLVTFHGEGSVFCAGADLKERRSLSEGETLAFLDAFRRLVALIERLPCVTAAVLQGAALGGGLELALGCDFIYAQEPTQLGLPEVGLGIIPGAGGTQRLQRRVSHVGLQRRMVLLGERLSAREACAAGLVDKVGNDAGHLDALVAELASSLARQNTAAVRAAKEAMRGRLADEAGLDLERACYRQLLASPARAAAIEAFALKK